MMHQISLHLPHYDCYFSPFYSNGFLGYLSERGILDFTILGGQFRRKTLEYFKYHKLKLDYKGESNSYNLVFTCSDLIVPKNLGKAPLILVQEGMTDPENFIYYMVKKFHLPRYLASTSATGLSDSYEIFCVASEGYKELFINKGVKPEKIIITGIPNYDNCKKYLDNDFPYKNYVLVATSDTRETFKYENRRKFIEKALKIAGGRQIIFKLHPNEKADRATAEINAYAPGAIVFREGNTEEMIANCDVLITKFSTVVYVGIALGKEVHSDFDINALKKLMPIQNGGRSAQNIANAARKLLHDKDEEDIFIVKKHLQSKKEVLRKYITNTYSVED
jgi:hypothetical protein